MTISATMVRDLREKTGAGIMECKAALAEAGGDMENAIDVLRKRGLKVAEKKAGRVAADGLVAAWTSPEGTAGALVEVNCETDFVARTEKFAGLAQSWSPWSGPIRPRRMWPRCSRGPSKGRRWPRPSRS